MPISYFAFCVGRHFAESCAIQICVQKHQEAQCAPGNYFFHHNSITTSLMSCHFTEGIHDLRFFYHILTQPSAWWIRKYGTFSSLHRANFVILGPVRGNFSKFLWYQRRSWWSFSVKPYCLPTSYWFVLGYDLRCTCIEFSFNLSCCCPYVVTIYANYPLFTCYFHQTLSNITMSIV